MSERPIEAAGAVVWRPAGDRLEVLVIHRVRHDDWSLPKGKLDPGEHALSAAVREVHEETGVAVRLGPLLVRHEYAMARPSGATKQVTYWCAVPRDGHGGASEDYAPNDEVDAVGWFGTDEARRRLTYARDGAVLERLESLVRRQAHRTSPLLVLRHGHAAARGSWDGADRTRPLVPTGQQQAERLVPLLAAYGVEAVLSSDSSRCAGTLEPYATAAQVSVERDHRWSDRAATRRGVHAATLELLATEPSTVLCTHRPVLPWVFEGLGVPQVKLEPGDASVVHRRSGEVLCTELLRP